MPKELQEMIDLLITEGKTTSQRTFITLMDHFIQRMPVIHSTDKMEFFIAYFLGGVYNFQHTQLKKELQVTSSFWKFGSDQRTLDFVFEINSREDNHKHLVFRSIRVLTHVDSTDMARENKLPYTGLNFKNVMLAKLDYKNADHKEGLSFQEEFYQTRYKAPSNTEVSKDFEKKLQALGFEKIECPATVAHLDEETINKFSLDEAQVKTALEAYLTGINELFKKFKPIFITQIDKTIKSYLDKHSHLPKKNINSYVKTMKAMVSTEAFSHGFLYGSLSLNFKNRYRIDAYVERIAGNGYTDLMMISRANGRLSNSVPIIIELKTGLISAREGITQIENKGYFQHVLSLRTYQEKAIIAGVNFNLADETHRLVRTQQTTRGDTIAVSTVSIPSKIDVLDHILKTSIDPLLSNRIKQGRIQKNLMELYYSCFGELNFRSFLSLFTGYVISYSGVSFAQNNNNLNDPTWLEKTFLLFDESFKNYQVLQNRFAALVIDFQDKGDKKTVIFELNRETGLVTKSQPKNPLPKLLSGLYADRKKKQHVEIHKISIQMDDNAQRGSAFFSSVLLESIDLSAVDERTAAFSLEENFHRLETLTFSDFFTKKNNEFVFASTLKNSVQKTIFPLQTLFIGEVQGQKKEYVFQAIMQGMIAGFNQDKQRVRTFIEPNFSAEGRADLVVALPSFNDQEALVAESIFVLEFKSVISPSKMKSLAQEALEQARKYTKNIKSLSDAREAKLMGLVMNTQAKQEDKFLSESTSQNNVDHISTDERFSSPERSNKRKRVDLSESSEDEGMPKVRCQRSSGTSCYIDFISQADEELRLINDLTKAREKGHVIFLSESYTLLLALVKTNNPVGKIVFLDEQGAHSAQIYQLLKWAQEAKTLEAYMQTVQLKFPKVATRLKQFVEQLGSQVDFEHFKSVLIKNQLILIKMNLFSDGNFKSEIQHYLGQEKISAIYIGEYEYRQTNEKDSTFLLKDHILSLLHSEESVDLYRKITPNNRQVSLYSGSKTYLDQEWQPLKTFSFDKHDEILLYLKEAQEWSIALQQTSHLNPDWIPILETAREKSLGQEQIHLVHRNTHEVRKIDLNGVSSTVLRENLNFLYKRMRDAIAFKPNSPEFFDDSTAIESVDGLNMAFTVQAIFDFMKARDRAQFQAEQGPLYTALQIHHYLNVAQMAHSTLLDVNKVVHIIKTLLREEINLAKKPLSLFQGLKQGANEGLGVLFGVTNVVLDSIELHEAKTAQEKATFGVQLALDIGGLSLSVASIGAATVGAATAASVLGAGSVIFSGLSIGTMALVQAFGRVAEEAKAVGNYFYQLNEAYRYKGYKLQLFAETNQSIMTPLYGAVVTEINFINNSIAYGSPYIYAAHYQGSGNGEMNYLIGFSVLPREIRKKQQAINIRECLGYPEKGELGNWKSESTWVLPSTAIIYLDYHWMILPGATSRHDRGFPVLRKIEKKNHAFYYDFYSWPSEFIINKVHQEIVTTPIKIRLNEQERTLVIPNFSEQDKKIVKKLHYWIEAPVSAGRCSILLNRMGLLTLQSHQTHYTWIVVTKDFSVDSLQFTETGMKIAETMLIKLISPHNETVLLVDKNRSVFVIVWPMKKMLLKELHFPFFKNDSTALSAYVSNKLFNRPIKLNDFPLHDHQNVFYEGIAYYSAENDYIYTINIPQSINEHADLVGCVINDCYFTAPPDRLWLSHRPTHQLKEKYLFYSSHFVNLLTEERRVYHGKIEIELESVVIQQDGSVMITQVFKNEHEKIIQRAGYRLIHDKLMLFTVEDDELLWIFIRTQDEAKLMTYLKRLFNHQPSLLPIWNDDYLQSYSMILEAEMGDCIKLTSRTENLSSHPVWLLKKGNDHYYRINPRIAETKLTFLGSLIAADSTEVFYFFLPAQNQSSAQLFRQSAGEDAAIPLELAITQAYFVKEKLFILTPENIVKNVNVLGETSIVGFNAAWIQTHPNDWWKKIPNLLQEENHSRKDPISLQGLSDPSGRVLAAWYAIEQHAFVVMRPPKKNQRESFQVNYVGHRAGIDFFFCENGILYQQVSFLGELSTSFQGTQLQRELPVLRVVADSLQAAYFYKKQLWFHQNGAIFSMDPVLPQLWYLEKLDSSWFQHKQLLREAFFYKKSKFIPKFKSEFNQRYKNNFFKNDSFLMVLNFSNNIGSFITNRNHALIPISVDEKNKLWWDPNKNQFFYNPFNDDISNWHYLGECADLLGVTGVCFFSPKAKMIFLNPDYHTYSASSCTSHCKVATELARVYQDVFVWVLEKWPASNETLWPLLNGKKILDVYISDEKSSSVEIPQVILNHYQNVSFYQFGFSEKNRLSSNDALRYSDHIWYQQAIEIPRAVVKKRDEVSKITLGVSAGFFTISFLSVFGAVTGLYCLLARRFRQNNLAALPLAVSLPLLSLETQGVASAETNSLVYCRKNFFKPIHCVQSESSIGLLGYCDNGIEALLWLNRYPLSTGDAPLLWYRLGHSREVTVTVSANFLSVDQKGSCRQTVDLSKIPPVSMTSLFPYLPNDVKQWLYRQWNHEKKVHDNAPYSLFKQLTRQVGLNYVVSECLLHTVVGDSFKLFNLQPNWREQDHHYYVARCLTAVQQLCWGDGTHPIGSLSAVGLETLLLHPKLTLYFNRTGKNARYAKQGIRFFADLIQFGLSNLAYLPTLLELLFPGYTFISTITLGLRMALSLFALNNDLSYCYLGIALFFLPQLPLLLEHLGIPVTYYVSQTLKKLTQFFMTQSLFSSVIIEPCSNRLREQESALAMAEQRVEQGRQRVSQFTNALMTFFRVSVQHAVDRSDVKIESLTKNTSR